MTAKVLLMLLLLLMLTGEIEREIERYAAGTRRSAGKQPRRPDSCEETGRNREGVVWEGDWESDEIGQKIRREVRDKQEV